MLIKNPLNGWLEKTSDLTLLAITHNTKCCDAIASVIAFEHNIFYTRGRKIMDTKIPIGACASSIALPNTIHDLTLIWNNETKKIKESLISLDIPKESISF